MNRSFYSSSETDLNYSDENSSRCCSGSHCPSSLGCWRRRRPLGQIKFHGLRQVSEYNFHTLLLIPNLYIADEANQHVLFIQAGVFVTVDNAMISSILPLVFKCYVIY